MLTTLTHKILFYCFSTGPDNFANNVFILLTNLFLHIWLPAAINALFGALHFKSNSVHSVDCSPSNSLTLHFSFSCKLRWYVCRVIFITLQRWLLKLQLTFLHKLTVALKTANYNRVLITRKKKKERNCHTSGS